MTGAPTPSEPTPRRAGAVAVAALVAFAVLPMLLRDRRAEPVFCAERPPPADDTVVMLSASWCGYCAAARDLFVARGIRYCEYDIETSPTGASRHAASGARGVPVIFVRDAVLAGYHRDIVLETLREQGLLPGS